jgi:outer membrane protein
MRQLRRRKDWARAAVLIAVFSGCASIPQAQSQQSLNASLSSTQQPPAVPTLTLKQAVSLALENSLDIKLVRMQYNVALAEAGVDRAAFRPNLYTGSGAAYTYGFPALPGGNAPALFQLDYTQSLFDPSLKAQQHAAEQRAKSARLEIDRIQNDVIARTATTYLELADVRHSLALVGSEQASAEKIIQVTRDRIQANQELPIEETRSELALAEVHQREVKLEGREAILSRQLRDLTGTSDDAPMEVEQTDESFSGALATQSDNEIVSLAIQNDQTIAEAEHDREAKVNLLHGARLSYFPTVEAVGQYSILSKFNNYGQFYKSFQRNNFTAGVQITIPLFAAKTSANVTFAKSQLAESETALANKRLQVRSGAQQQQQNLRELEAERDVANWALKLAQQTFDLQQSKMQQGQATLADVEQAQLDENEKFVEFLDANFAQQKAQISLLQATGQLAKVFQ